MYQHHICHQLFSCYSLWNPWKCASVCEGRCEWQTCRAQGCVLELAGCYLCFAPCCRCARWDGWSESAPWARTPRGRTGSWPATIPCECSPLQGHCCSFGTLFFLPYLLLCFSQPMFCMLCQECNFNYYNTSLFLLFYGFCLGRWLLAVDGWKCLWAHSWFHQLPEILISRDFSISELVQYLFPLNFQEIEFFVHQNVPNSLTVNIIMIFIH